MTQQPLSDAKALEAFHAIVAVLDTKLGYDGELVARTKDATPTEQGTGDPQWFQGPVLCRGFEGMVTSSSWAVVWEDGEYEWVHLDALFRSGVAGVEWGPHNGFALSLYRSED